MGNKGTPVARPIHITHFSLMGYNTQLDEMMGIFPTYIVYSANLKFIDRLLRFQYASSEQCQGERLCFPDKDRNRPLEIEEECNL
jgi:hypothetical protein